MSHERQVYRKQTASERLPKAEGCTKAVGGHFERSAVASFATLFLQLRPSVAFRHLHEVASGVRTYRRSCILRCGEVLRRSVHACSVPTVSGGILRDCVVVLAAKCYDRHLHEVASGVRTDQAVMHTVFTRVHFERLAGGGVPRAVGSGSAGERASRVGSLAHVLQGGSGRYERRVMREVNGRACRTGL